MAIRIALFVVLCFGLLGCAYRFGYGQRNLPGGYQKVAIPVFENITNEVGIETSFTNALIRQFARSQVAQVALDEAPVRIEGKITSVRYSSLGLVEAKSANPMENKNQLPLNAVQAGEYRIYVAVHLELKRTSDQSVLWNGTLNGERVYTAPQVGKSIINSVNPIYNHSARREVIDQLAFDMMNNAHDRITENF